jgi:hypothetical protein
MSSHGRSGGALIRPQHRNLISNKNHNCNAKETLIIPKIKPPPPPPPPTDDYLNSDSFTLAQLTASDPSGSSLKGVTDSTGHLLINSTGHLTTLGIADGITSDGQGDFTLSNPDLVIQEAIKSSDRTVSYTNIYHHGSEVIGLWSRSRGHRIAIAAPSVIAETSSNAAQIEYWNTTAGETWARFQEALDRQVEPLSLAAMDALCPGEGEHALRAL